MSLCLRFGNQRNGDLLIKLQRWHRKVGAGNTTVYPNLLTSRVLKNTQLRRPVPFFPFILDQDAFMQIYFDIKLKTDKLCVSDTCFLYVYWYIGQPPTPTPHTHTFYTLSQGFFFLVTFLTILKETHMYTSLWSRIQINLMKCSSSTCHLFIPRRFKKRTGP